MEGEQRAEGIKELTAWLEADDARRSVLSAGHLECTVDIIDRAEYAELEVDAKVELIRALVPLGLMHIEELLDEEVTALAGERYAGGASPPAAPPGRTRRPAHRITPPPRTTRHRARASTGRRPGRLRRSAGGHRRRRTQGARPGRGSAAQRRRVREGLSGGDDGGVLRWAQRCGPRLRRRAASHRLRRHHAGGGADAR